MEDIPQVWPVGFVELSACPQRYLCSWCRYPLPAFLGERKTQYAPSVNYGREYPGFVNLHGLERECEQIRYSSLLSISRHFLYSIELDDIRCMINWLFMVLFHQKLDLINTFVHRA